jgi:hypothetical protein
MVSPRGEVRLCVIATDGMLNFVVLPLVTAMGGRPPRPRAGPANRR